MDQARMDLDTTTRLSPAEAAKFLLERWSMLPLAIAVVLDFYLIASLIVDGYWAPIIACGIFSVFVLLWFVLPRSARLERIVLGASCKRTPLR